MSKTSIFLWFLLVFLILSGQSCAFLGGTSKQVLPDGGIFKSVDSGENWSQKAWIYALGGERKDFSKAGTLNITLDPNDHEAIYLGSAGSGLFYSYNGGTGWQQPNQIMGGNVSAVAVDPKNKCTIFLVIGNMILKSTDCNRGYANIYQDTRPEVMIKSLVIDSFNSNIIYVGNTVGDLLKSTDTGKSWTVAYRFENPVLKIIINPTDTKKIYIATQDKGIYRTGDGGASWVSLSEGLKQYGGAFVYHDLLLFEPKAERLLLSSQYGLIKTEDVGVTWKALNLLTPPNSADIKVVGVNPKNFKEIYYSTLSTFYKSVDGGEKWVTKKLPSSRAPSSLLIDPLDPKIIYLGFEASKK